MKTPCVRKVRSFLGVVMYYKSFFVRCSAKVKALLKLTAEPGLHHTGLCENSADGFSAIFWSKSSGAVLHLL